MRDRLIELIKAAKTKESFDTIFADIDTLIDMPHGEEYLADYLLANGVIVPPCKVGDWVYVVTQGQGLCMRWNVYEGKVVDIHLNRRNKLTIRVENGEKFFGYYEPCFVHKNKEEAEKALEGMNNA